MFYKVRYSLAEIFLDIGFKLIPDKYIRSTLEWGLGIGALKIVEDFERAEKEATYAPDPTGDLGSDSSESV